MRTYHQLAKFKCLAKHDCSSGNEGTQPMRCGPIAQGAFCHNRLVVNAILTTEPNTKLNEVIDERLIKLRNHGKGCAG